MLVAYVAGYIVAVILALVFARRELFSAERWRSMREPWRLVTLGLGVALIAGAAPYSGDPTWDVTNSILIGVLVYAIAPWSVATIRREVIARRFGRELACALVLFFVPCWAYDLYILFRDGYYPASWDANLVLSGILTLCAGVFWNLTWRPGMSRVRFFGLMTAVSLPVVVMVAAFVITELH